LWLEAGQKLDAERQVKKDDIELKRLIKLKKVPRPAKVDRRGD
jgi:ribosome biogenesis GTPase A